MNLLLEKESKKIYQYSKRNQQIVLKLKDFIIDETVDQLPTLVDLQRYLEELSMMDPPDTLIKPAIILPVIMINKLSEIYSEMMDQISLPKIIIKHRNNLVNMSHDEKRAMAVKLAKLYDFAGIEDLICETNCAHCGNEARNRCSLCRVEWYCSRACQVAAWKSHKKCCDTLREGNDKKEATRGQRELAY